ncbi:prolyl 3-hydroxylase OGFOD1 [Orussus abietinus]|uniref:prolyl 3-hydroxylase OGFOD1 n=1 Tax=Orussus abietinus TaxID=222816 RepID=UPI000624FFA2|nr:prolyl 3-hydroxylase OGFOD1 [Orussus abietinus]
MQSSCKKQKKTVISEHVYALEFQEEVSKHWQEGTPIKKDNLEMITEPFRVCRISNFLDNELLEKLKEDVQKVPSRRSDIDLYRFEHTEDLANVDATSVRALRDAFTNDIVSWMERNTGIELDGKVSMASSKYIDGDYLLCHDDNMGDRRIAYVLYLTKNWLPKDGGALELFNKDKDGSPKNVVYSLLPEYNSLVFFEVTENSYHQVAEVTSDKTRLSVNGWFHGPIDERKPKNSKRSEIPEPPLFDPEENVKVKLQEMINELYLKPSTIEQIQENVEQESYVFLSNFFKKDLYQKISEEIASKNIKWTKVGPADLRNYETASEDSFSDELKRFLSLFRSIEFFRLLKGYTELDLEPSEDIDKDCGPKGSMELQRWTCGDYTLMSDKLSSDQNMSMSWTNNMKRDRFNKDPKEFENSCRSKYNDDGCKGATNSPKQAGGSDTVCATTKKTTEEKSNSTLTPRAAQPSSARSSDYDDSDVSDIGDYLSDQDDHLEDSGSNESSSQNALEPGTLDVILQFHTGHLWETETIDYMEPEQQDGALITIPAEDNHLCLVYRTQGTTRVHRYVSHREKEFFYNLVCTYHEQSEAPENAD